MATTIQLGRFSVHLADSIPAPGLASSDSAIFTGSKKLKPIGISLKGRTRRAFERTAHCSLQAPPPAWPGRAIVDEDRKVWDGPKPFSIVGSTGSIGTQTLEIVAEHPDKFRVVALAAGSNVTLLADQVRRFKPKLVSIGNESLVAELKESLGNIEPQPEILFGDEGIIEVARHPEAVSVVTGIVGCAGLKPTVAAIEAGKDIALANKETLIAGGPFVLPLAHKHKVKILPADSEHSAIFQCIQGLPEGALRRIILTASGGAFRDWPVEKLKVVKVADALKHPNWNMGKKITVDSATLFNKGLEVISILVGKTVNSRCRVFDEVIIYETSRIAMEFCPTCGNLLQIEHPYMSQSLRFFCPTCPYVSPIERKISKKLQLKKKEVDDVFGGEEAWKNVDRTEATCPKCSFGKAFFMQIQIRSADEPMSTFYKCCNNQCQFRWRQD